MGRINRKSLLASRIGGAVLALGLAGCIVQQPAPSAEAVAHQIEQDVAAARSQPPVKAASDAAAQSPDSPAEATTDAATRQQAFMLAQQTFTDLNHEYRTLTALLDNGLGAYYPDDTTQGLIAYKNNLATLVAAYNLALVTFDSDADDTPESERVVVKALDDARAPLCSVVGAGQAGNAIGAFILFTKPALGLSAEQRDTYHSLAVQTEKDFDRQCGFQYEDIADHLESSPKSHRRPRRSHPNTHVSGIYDL